MGNRGVSTLLLLFCFFFFSINLVPSALAIWLTAPSSGTKCALKKSNTTSSFWPTMSLYPVITPKTPPSPSSTGVEPGLEQEIVLPRDSYLQDELLPMVQSRNLTLAFSSESSVEEELKRESTADATTVLVSYLVMFAYISLTLGDTLHPSFFYISSKVLLGLSGVILVMLSVLGSVGFFSVLGVKSTLIVMEVIHFLVLAVGVDNMCILVHAVKRQRLELPLEGRISNALAEVGPSITLASVSEVLAFAVGSFISMPAIRVYSMFAALAVLLDFLLQVTAFVALIVLDSLRAEDKRVDCFPCIKPPCCAAGDSSCDSVGTCKDCTTNDRPSTTQFREKLPWFLSSLPSADCAKGGHGAYTSSVELKGYNNSIIPASSFRTYHTPLNKQIDYVNSMMAAREFSSRVSDSLKNSEFKEDVVAMEP
ncbi:hypothetical protein VNO80_17596 [Phaseolus coccineus]|uniref:SSD domain-containing protein n=1 Tax=Phaseolus coccineus TaxID=3886 RepID=A0AAN9MIU0_PHACN